jgi:hypothetical protein
MYMDIIKNLFSPREFQFVLAHTPPVSQFFSNFSRWAPELYQGHLGQVLMAPANHWINGLVQRAVQRQRPHLNCENLEIFYYRWLEFSAINSHRDSKYLWAATVYLNSYWDPQWGGIFHWTDSNSLIHSLTPCENTAVINHSRLSHWVTPVLTDQPRLTIQIFAR